MMLCPKCHTNNPDGEKYCRNCGFQLNASRICPECGAHNKHDTKFCRECGASLSPVSSFRRDIIDNQNAPFFDKYKSLIIAAIILVLAVGAVTGIALYNNASSNTGGSDDGFSFFPLANDTNQDNIQVDDVNDTNESVNETNKTLNDTDKNKTSDKNKNNSTDKNKNATKKKTSDSNNNAIINKTNKSVESVENHSKEVNSNDNNDPKNTFLDYNSDKSSKSVSYDSKSDKSSKSVSYDTKSEESSKSDSSDFREILDNQTYLNESTDSTTADEEDDGNISDENNTILLVGYMAENTLGRKILEGEKEVHILGDLYHVNAKVEQINAFSAHADYNEMTQWLKSIDTSHLKNIFLVHGEHDAQNYFVEHLHKNGFPNVTIVKYGENYEL